MKNRNLPRDDNWATPLNLYNPLHEEFKFDFDPCPYCEGPICRNGLNITWGMSNFVNPPYSNQLKTAFVFKALEQFKLGKTCVLLLPVSTSTVLFHEYIYPNAEIRFIKGRVKFEKIRLDGTRIKPPYGPMHDSMIVIFRGNNALV